MKLINNHLNYDEMITLSMAQPNSHIVGFTANRTETISQDLVMGAGAAKAFKVATKDFHVHGMPVPKYCGYLMNTLGARDRGFALGDLTNKFHENVTVKICLLFTKNHWRGKADLEMTRKGLISLGRAAKLYSDMTIHINYPAIGLGGLDIEEVEPYVNALPDNVWVYK